MADNQQEKKVQKPSRVSYYGERFRRWVVNKAVSKVPFFSKFGAKRQPQITREEKAETADIRRELSTEFQRNRDLLTQLRNIEKNWNALDDIIWKEDDEGSLINLYKKASYLVDPVQAEEEARTFREGTQIRNVAVQKDIGTPTNPERVTINSKELGSKIFNYIEPDGDTITEDLSIIGYNNARQFEGIWETEYNNWKSKIENDPRLATPLTGIVNLMNTTVNVNISNWIKTVLKREEDFHRVTLSPNVTITKSIQAKRSQLDEIRPTNIRFRHTYKIIAPVIRDSAGNPKHFSQEIQTTNPNFKRADEVEAGKDENGYPLEVQKVNNLTELKEVTENEPGVWIVLLDRWWMEIASNPWQKQRILSKTARGGPEIWSAKVTNGVGENPPYNIRIVLDETFVKDVDILDMAVYIYNEFDAYRDDLRDGRYHHWSKSCTDYIIAAEGISTLNHEEYGRLPYKRGMSNRVPIAPIPFGFYPMRDYVRASPSDFENVSDDERRVTREYQMKLNPNPQLNITHLPGRTYAIEEDVRRPTHLNPAFDRRALNAKSDVGPGRFFIHWGRMYYYEDASEINKWSENPFPHVTTRGIAKWIIYRILMDLPWEIAVETAKNDDGYDYGIRRPLVGGEFIKDPLGATDLISKVSPIG